MNIANETINKTKISNKQDEKLEEVKSAFQVLGYNNKQIQDILTKIYNPELGLEELIKLGLQELAKR